GRFRIDHSLPARRPAAPGLCQWPSPVRKGRLCRGEPGEAGNAVAGTDAFGHEARDRRRDHGLSARGPCHHDGIAEPGRDPFAPAAALQICPPGTGAAVAIEACRMMRAFLPSRILVLARRRLRRFRADEDGVVLIATTILAPLLLVMLAFAVEMGS